MPSPSYYLYSEGLYYVKIREILQYPKKYLQKKKNTIIVKSMSTWYVHRDTLRIQVGKAKKKKKRSSLILEDDTKKSGLKIIVIDEFTYSEDRRKSSVF